MKIYCMCPWKEELIWDLRHQKAKQDSDSVELFKNMGCLLHTKSIVLNCIACSEHAQTAVPWIFQQHSMGTRWHRSNDVTGSEEQSVALRLLCQQHLGKLIYISGQLAERDRTWFDTLLTLSSLALSLWSWIQVQLRTEGGYPTEKRQS